MSQNSHIGLGRLNRLSETETENELLKCCGSKDWARLVMAERPFESVDDLITRAERVWWSLEPRAWLEAFHSHPKIGEKKAASAVAAEAQGWSEDEQSGTRNSTQDTMEALAQLNRMYEEKFGYIFIVCASGKSSEEMVATLRARLENPADQELRIAAAEHAKITQLRLKRLLAINDDG